MPVTKPSILGLIPNFAESDLVGIELTAASLKLCHFRISPGGKFLLSAAVHPAAGKSEDELAKTLLVFSRGLNVKRPRYCLFIPSQLVITKNIEVPSVDQKEIREIVNLQAGRHTPYSREEVIVDYIPLGVFKQNYTKVLLLIVNSGVIKKQFAILDKAGIRVERAVFVQEALAAFAEKAFKLDPAAVNALIHIESASTDFSVVSRNKVMFVRSIPIGRQLLVADRQKALDKFKDEVKKSLDSYQVENIEKQPAALILTGVLDGVEDLDTVLNEACRIPVRIVQYLPGVPAAGKGVSAKEKIKDESLLDVSAGILSLADCRTSIIPEEVKSKMALVQRGRDLMVTAIAVLSILILLFVTMMTGVYFKNEYLRKLDDKYRNLGTEAEKLESDFQKNNQVRSYLAGRGSSVRVLSELYALAPLELQLNYIKFEKDGKFIIRGTADSRSAIFSFADGIEKSPYFSEVKTKNTTKRQEGQREVTDFEVNCQLDNKAVK